MISHSHSPARAFQKIVKIYPWGTGPKMNNPDPGDDLGDGRAASRLVELGERGFSRALSPQCDGCARGHRGGRSGVPAGSGGGQARF